VLFKDGRSFQIEGSEGMYPWASLRSLGNSSLFYLVSYFYHPTGSEGAADVTFRDGWMGCLARMPFCTLGNWFECVKRAKRHLRGFGE
jgi:hypothetical protein